MQDKRYSEGGGERYLQGNWKRNSWKKKENGGGGRRVKG